MQYLIFVYGTLKRGYQNHSEALAPYFMAEATTCDAYPMQVLTDRWVPVLLPEPGHGFRVSGELYRVPPEVLADLDELESVGHPKGYHRQSLKVQDGKGQEYDAEAYFKHRHLIAVPMTEPQANYAYDPRYCRLTDTEG